MDRHREILISLDEFETRAAILEDRQLVEFYIEEADRPRIAGNIYYGRIKDILPGMEASFVDIGLERNAFLYVDEVLVPEAEFDSPPHQIQKLLKPGQELMVQVLKEPVGTKGARVTTQIALPGRKIVLLPLNRFVGVSKRLAEAERTRLHGLAEELCPPEMGVIVRTAAADAAEEELAADIRFLTAMWRIVQERVSQARAPALLFKELDLAERIIRDVFSPDYDHLIVDSAHKRDELVNLVDKMSPKLKGRIRLHQGKLSLFEKHNIETQIEVALKRRVWLRSGGYIAIDKTEALTGIDVNTAKYTGGSNLEQTIFKTNTEAAVEIVKQLRLRDIGGIIVIDFIDMHDIGHRDAIYQTFMKALEEDRTKTRVSEISRLGLLEMTRKNISEGVQAHYFEACPVCGSGRILSKKRAAIETFRRIRHIVAVHQAQAFVFKVATETAETLEREGWHARFAEQLGKIIYINGSPGVDRGEAVLLREGRASQIEKFLDESDASLK